ncbi:MAG: hypothetical protein KAT91_03865 [Candidatus Aenigmarchaeota archaeon]|nr:hypothetical protein [Candidatus Aenigmarchaeota archaeon]
MSSDEIIAGNLKLNWVSPPPKMFVEGKYYSDPPIQIGSMKYKFVKLEPGIHAGKHNHKGQNMQEWHQIISGTGWCVIYNNDGSIKERIRLEPGKFSPMLDSDSPDHEFINDDKEPMIYLAIERFF